MKELNQIGAAGALFIIVVLVVVGGFGYYIWNKNGRRNPFKDTVTSFQECVAAGNPVQESYPEVCRSKDGRSFTNPEQVAE